MTDSVCFWACALDRKRPVPEQLAWMTDLYAELHSTPPQEAHMQQETVDRMSGEVGVRIVENAWVPRGSIYFPIARKGG